MQTETHSGTSLAEYDAEHPLKDNEMLSLGGMVQDIAVRPQQGDSTSPTEDAIDRYMLGLIERIEKLEAAQPRKAYRPDLEQQNRHADAIMADVGEKMKAQGMVPVPPAKTRGQEVAETAVKIVSGQIWIESETIRDLIPIAPRFYEGDAHPIRKWLASLIDAERADAAKQENAACVKWLTDAATCHDREMRKGNASYDREFHETQSRAARSFAKEIALNPKPTFG